MSGFHHKDRVISKLKHLKEIQITEWKENNEFGYPDIFVVFTQQSMQPLVRSTSAWVTWPLGCT